MSVTKLLFSYPDGRELRHEVEMPDATTVDVNNIPTTDAEPWSWCVDSMNYSSMDYSMALSALAGVS